jgi:Domain of unknown function (DUF4157)
MSDRAYAKAPAQQKTVLGSSAKSSLLQRTCACGQHTLAGGECEECRKKQEGTLQRAAIGSQPILQEVLRSQGQPLDAGKCAFMGPRFGQDFSRIPTYTSTAGVLQAKLAINQPGDEYELEADRIADQVLAAPAGVAISGAPSRIQRFIGQAPGPADTAPASVDHVLASSSRPLDLALRQDMEQRFGHDFSQVRVHSGAAAEQSAREVNANAYTVGHNIVFGAGQFAPGTHQGRRLIAHELTHVAQQGAVPRVPGTTTPQLHAGGSVVQRDTGAPVHSPAAGVSSSGVPYEKSGPDVEATYRRAGLTEAATAVRGCRELGACAKVLTESEAYTAYRTGRITAGLGDPGATAVAGMVAPGLAPEAAPALGGAAETAVARAAARWGTAAVLEGGAAAEAAPAVAGAAAPATAGVATVAVPIAVGVIIVIAVVDLFFYASFQRKLRELGYVILPSPLGVCIGLCHQPSAPTFPQRFPPTSPIPPFPRRLSDEELRRISEWLKPSPTPIPTPVPVPTRPRDKREECQSTHPYALICSEMIDLEEVVMSFLLTQGISFTDIVVIQCQGVGSFGPGAIDACEGAPGEIWHCRVTIRNQGSGVVSVFGCLCCHEDGTTDFEWRGAHWSVNLSRRGR